MADNALNKYIHAETLKRDLIDNRGFYPAIVNRALIDAPAADVVEIETLKDWLITTAINDVTFVHDGYFPKACTKLVSQLDKLREFAKERSL